MGCDFFLSGATVKAAANVAVRTWMEVGEAATAARWSSGMALDEMCDSDCRRHRMWPYRCAWAQPGSSFTVEQGDHFTFAGAASTSPTEGGWLRWSWQHQHRHNFPLGAGKMTTGKLRKNEPSRGFNFSPRKSPSQLSRNFTVSSEKLRSHSRFRENSRLQHEDLLIIMISTWKLMLLVFCAEDR